MANRFWVGGTDTWDTTAGSKWSTTTGGSGGASAPGSSDKAVFDANSGIGIVTISSPSQALDFDSTNFGGTITGSSNWTVGSNVTGGARSFIIGAGCAWTYSGTLTFLVTTASSGTYTITSNGKTITTGSLGGATSSGGTIKLADDLICGTFDCFRNSVYDLNNKNVTCSSTFIIDTNGITVSLGSGLVKAAIFTLTATGCTITGGVLECTSGSFTQAAAYTFTSVKLGSGASAPGAGGIHCTGTLLITGTGNKVFSTGTYTCGDLDFTGYTGTLSGTGAISFSGSLTLASGMTFSHTGTLTGTATGTGKTLNMVGKTLNNLTLSGVGGGWTLTANMAITNALTLTNGNFSDGAFTVSLASFSSNNSNTRVLTMSAAWTVSGSSGTVWDVTTSTGMTLTSTASTINLTNTGASDKTFIGGGLTYNNITISASGAGKILFTDSNTFNVFTCFGPKSLRFTVGTTMTLTGTPVMSGTAGNLITIDSSSAGSVASISKASGVVSCDYLSLKDNTATGGAAFFAGTHSTNVSGNTGWTFSAPVTNFVKTFGDLANALVKTIDGIINANVKTWDDISNI